MKTVLVIILSLLNITKCNTHSENPFLFLISFDGFRWDYLEMYDLPYLKSLYQNGSHAKYIMNTYPTSTFPNHWSMVTGLYEESHGILDNSMYDSSLGETFSHKKPESQKLEWFGQNKLAEPIWLTNQRGGNGRRSAAQWPGALVKFPDDEKTIRLKFDPNTAKNFTNSANMIKKILDWFESSTKDDEPINFAAFYFDQPDSVGHLYGPYASETRETLLFLDSLVGFLINELKTRHLIDKMNVNNIQFLFQKN
jgi:predicted AlkP superfamily pyrophosphatase or phosphodiesterase